ncbi:hypothetical protein H1S01_12640 [Heliobacterium chlorum]|uniref:Uncharacterized protein n=1 Tax=Heliobacterium chlorum TaxID=2698 RepID=A0ABR7T3K1_HELCL|nr:hypothetical protein [Heliobacterium chlorum]MBC9785357.1 hypothetical protein [Heliobacterium chlorum]
MSTGQFEVSGAGPTNSKIQVGVSNVFYLKDAHTYTVIDKNIYFHCYWTAEIDDELFFPKQIYSPDKTPLGTEVDCNLYIARGLAEFKFPYPRKDPDPTRRHYSDLNREDGYKDWCGIIYAITGVCHQMCNVILFSASKGTIDSAPLNWPDNFDNSQKYFGRHGLGLDHILPLMYAILEKRSKNIEDPATILEDDVKELQEAYYGSIRKWLDTTIQKDSPHIETLLRNFLVSDEDKPSVIDEFHKFASIKQDLDNQLIRGTVSMKEYLESVNKSHNGLAELMASIKNCASFEPTNLIHPAQMPDSAYYEFIKETLGIK